MYEVELKVELTAEEREKLISLFKEQNFLFKGVTPQNDFWIEARESKYGGFDLKRCRHEAGKFIYTEKIWEETLGNPARRENEHEMSREEFESTVAQYPDALKINKTREWFAGAYKDIPISITIDSVKFDHSQSMRYFIEAEIDVQDKEEVQKTKDLILEFLKELLDKSEIIESPGMFTMVFKKL